MKFNFKHIIHISTIIILITKLRPKYLQYLFCPKFINLFQSLSIFITTVSFSNRLNKHQTQNQFFNNFSFLYQFF